MNVARRPGTDQNSTLHIKLFRAHRNVLETLYDTTHSGNPVCLNWMTLPEAISLSFLILPNKTMERRLEHAQFS